MGDGLLGRANRAALICNGSTNSSRKPIDAVADIRGYSMSGTLDLAPEEKPGQRGFELIQTCFDAGLVMKTTGGTLFFSPSFMFEDKYLSAVFTKIREVLSTH